MTLHGLVEGFFDLSRLRIAKGETFPEQEGTPPRRTGRPAIGEKSGPNYCPVTAYVQKNPYRDVTEALYDDSRGRDAKPKEFVSSSTNS